MAKRKLIWQIYPSYLLIILAAIITIGWFSWYSFERFYIGQTRDVLRARAGIIGSQIKDTLTNADAGDLNREIARISEISDTRITVIALDGTVLADSHEDFRDMENHSGRPEFIAAVREDFGSSIRFSRTLGQRLMYGAVPIVVDGQQIAVIRTSAKMTDLQIATYDTYRNMFIFGVVIAIISAVLSLWISRRITEPLVDMTSTAELFAKGRLEHRIVAPDSAELASLAAAMNKMAGLLHERLGTVTKQRNELEAILSSMAEGVIAVDENFRLVIVNQAAAKFLNIDAEKASGRSIEEAIRNPQIQDFVQKTLRGEGTVEADMVMSTNGKHYFQLRGVSLHSESESPFGAVIVLNDITHIHKLETVRRDFVANVSHELKTPITSIKGFVETLLDSDFTNTEQSRRFLEIVSRHADRLNSIIDDLLSLSRLEQADQVRELSFVKTPLRPLLENVIQASKPAADEKQININLQCSDYICAIANGPLLEQAVANLVNNAVKYSDTGTNIQVAAANTEDDYVSISVQDSGCGIEKKHQQRIFERFYVVDKGRSRKLGGTGLGLAIVKHICNAHGGYICVESLPGKGSTFTITIPSK